MASKIDNINWESVYNAEKASSDLTLKIEAFQKSFET